MGLRLITDATVEPITLTQAKKQLEIADGITRHNDQLDRLITTVRKATERLTRRAWINQTWRLTFRRFPDCRLIQLPRPPLVSVTSVAYVDTNNVSQTLVANTDYVVRTNSQPGVIALARSHSWPSTESEENEAVTITYVAGYGATAATVPAEAKQAMLLMLRDWWEIHGRGSVVIGTNINEVPQSAKWLLEGLHCGMKLGAYEVTE